MALRELQLKPVPQRTEQLPAVRVWLLDDERFFLRSMEVEFGEGNEYTLRTFSEPRNFLERLSDAELLPHVVLLDIHLAGRSGITLVKPIKARSSLTRVLMLTSSDNDAIIKDALKEGADGYLLKGVPFKKVQEAIRECLQGGMPIDAFAAAKAFRSSSAVGKMNYEFTEKQMLVLKHMADGTAYEAIAKKTFTSVKTVSTHAQHIFQKLGVHSRGEAVAKAKKEGLI